MHAVILAGGKGIRLRPYTTRLPKPLVPIGEEHSIMEIALYQLAQSGFDRVTLAIGHFGNLIQSYIGDGSRWGMHIDYTAPEDVPLGTIGPVLRILDRLPEQFLIMNGDVLTDLDYADLMRQHREAGASLTIATYRRKVKVDYGVLTTRDGQDSGLYGEAGVRLPRQHGRLRVLPRASWPGTRPACPSGSTSWCWTCWPGTPRRTSTRSTGTGSTSGAPRTTTGPMPTSA